MPKTQKPSIERHENATPTLEEALFVNLKSIIRKHVAETHWLTLPVYLTLVDEPSEVIWHLRLDSLDRNFQLLQVSSEATMRFPVEVFAAPTLYPDEMVPEDKFVQVYSELIPVGNGLNWVSSDVHPMHIIAEIEAIQKQNFEVLGWRRYDWAEQPAMQ